MYSSRLTVLEEFTVLQGGKRRGKMRCRCSCGNTVVVSRCGVKSGRTKSCGCLRRENTAKMFFIHGGKSTMHYTYASYQAMIARCYRPSQENYDRYGGRGIRICARWRKSFKNFLRDMGERPRGTTIDRIDGNGNYTPNNCRWATGVEQRNNRIQGDNDG